MNKAVIRLMGVTAAGAIMVGSAEAAALVSAPAASAATAGSTTCRTLSPPAGRCLASISVASFRVLTAQVDVLVAADGGVNVTATARTSGLIATANAVPPAVSVSTASRAANHSGRGKPGGGGSGAALGGGSAGGTRGNAGRHRTGGSRTGAASAGAAGAPPMPSAAVAAGVPGWFRALASGRPAGGSRNVSAQLPSIPADRGSPPVTQAADPTSRQVVGTQLLGLAALCAAVSTVLATLRRRRPPAAGAAGTAEGPAETAEAKATPSRP
jgi:hypothetical protein